MDRPPDRPNARAAAVTAAPGDRTSDAIALLQDAARDGAGGTAAIDRMLRLIDTLDTRCQAALNPTGTTAPPTG